MTFYRWSMRNGSIILFLAALLLFVVSFANYFFVTGAAMNRAIGEEGLTASKFVLFWGAIAQGVSNSVWAFLGACLIDRLNRHWGEGVPK